MTSSIKTFQVGSCEGGGGVEGCLHECTITLTYASPRSRRLTAAEINEFYQEVARKKIISEYPDKHFRKYARTPKDTSGPDNSYGGRDPDEILKRLFSNNWDD